MYVCMYVCMYAYTCMYYIYIYIYTLPRNIKRPSPTLPNIKTGFRRFGFNIRGVSGAYGYDWDYCNQTVAPEP